MAKPEAKDDRKLRSKVAKAVAENGPKEAILEIGNAKVFLHELDLHAFEEQLDWAIDFWKNERELIPTRNPNKCQSCEYSTECELSLAESAR